MQSQYGYSRLGFEKLPIFILQSKILLIIIRLNSVISRPIFGIFEIDREIPRNQPNYDFQVFRPKIELKMKISQDSPYGFTRLTVWNAYDLLYENQYQIIWWLNEANHMKL